METAEIGSVEEQLVRMLRGAKDVGRGAARAGAALPADLGSLLSTILPLPKTKAAFDRMSEGAKHYVSKLLGGPEESELAQTSGELLGPPAKTAAKLGALVGMIGGRRSADAQKMSDFLKGQKSGASRDDLWRETEMFDVNNPARIGPEGAPIPGHVLNTEGSSINLPKSGQILPADQVLQNAPNVFNNYSELRSLPVKGYTSKDSTIGYLRSNPKTGEATEIGMNLHHAGRPDFGNVIHHELGHGVQGIEGMPLGTNTTDAQHSMMEAAQILPKKMSDLQRSFMARTLADATYGEKAVDNRLINIPQLQARMRQVHGGGNLNSEQLTMMLRNNPEQLQGHITEAKNLSDLMPPSGFHNYDYTAGEVMSRLAEVYAGKSPEWVKQNPPWMLMKQIGIDDPSRIYDKAWFDPDKLRKIGL